MNGADRSVVVIGGGQAGLAMAYYLRRAEVDFVIVDAGSGSGGAWVHTWDSLRLFSPAAYSSLPGWPMTATKGSGYPSRDEAIDYLTRYETRYEFPIDRPRIVEAVERDGNFLRLRCQDGESYRTQAVVSATGTWSKPYVPDYPGITYFTGMQLHSAHYRNANPFVGKRVAVVGGGNSGAQILAEVSRVAETIWITPREPAFLPDEVDGRVLFERATARVRGDDIDATVSGLGDIVMVPSVKEARERGALKTVRPFERLTPTGLAWHDGTISKVDAVIWCTGFLPATDHLKPLGIVTADGKVKVVDQRSVDEPRLWLAGYGNWTGAASATLIGAARTARDLAPRIVNAVAESQPPVG
ncbi:MAG: pyridine nucleotide-disulfide oxidoreductase [Kaistia sp. SCN 65-12]|nr:MAG: pyridine nucleotide-disulfide oxidoreductase [Kaistia sp. SCN 65-12]